MPKKAQRGVSAGQSVPVWRARIRKAVANHGDLARIARSAQMTSSQLQKIENGKTKDPGISTIERIAVAMGTTLRDLVDPRPEGEAGHEGRVGSSSGLEQLVSEADDQDGTVESDIARAIAILGGALERQRRREATDRETPPPQRGTATDR